MRRARFVSAALALALATAAGSARSQATPDDEAATVRAERMYEAGKRLVAEGKTEEGCRQFDESFRLEPAIGTLFNLADCHERAGRLATALRLFGDVAHTAQLTGKLDRQRAAQSRVAKLQPLAPRLRIAMAAPRDGQRARLDERDVDVHDERGIPLDPGVHRLRVEAPGATTFEAAVTAPAGGEVVRVDVPELAVATKEVVRRVEVTVERPTLQRPVAMALAGAGAVGLVLGGVFGAVAMSQKADARCNGTNCTAPEADAAKLRDAQQSGTVSTVAFVAGGVLAVAGLTLWVTAPPRSAAPGLAAQVTLTPGRMAVQGTW